MSGICDCDAGYEGAVCDSVSRNKFLGDYNYASTDSVNCPQSGTLAEIKTSSVSIDRIIFENTATGTQFYALVDETSLTIPFQDVVGASGIKIEGDGSYDASTNPDKVTITVDLSDASGPLSTCTFIYTKI